MSLGGADRVIIGSKKEKLINGFFYYIRIQYDVVS